MHVLRSLGLWIAVLGCNASPSGADRPLRSASPFESERATVERLTAEGLGRGAAFAMLEELCTLAPKRLSGSPGAARAVEWAESAMKRAGLENVRLEPVLVPHWERGSPERCVVTAPADLAGRELPVLALGGSVATREGGIEAELLLVTGFDELAGLGERARGKIILFARPMDPALADPFEAYGKAVDQRGLGAIEAGKAGALAALVRSMSQGQDDLPHTGSMRYQEGVPRIPAAALSTNAAAVLATRLLAGESVRLRLELSCRTLEDVLSHNVVGELVGRERPAEVLLVGGHLDAWDVGSGAHDDGAGCVQSIEALRLVRALGLRPRRTLRVVLWMNEENGLRGGAAYRETHLAELGDHALALESDRGGFTPRGFSTNARGELFELMAAAAALLEPVGADRVVAGSGGADISPLEQDGVPLVGYVPDAHRYFDLHHTPADVLSNVHPRELELGAVAIAGFLWCLAEHAGELPR